MGREGDEDHATMAVNSSSSIALLQERFRRLQRAKQMREERELLRGDNGASPVNLEAAAGLFFHPEMMMSISSPSPDPRPQAHVGLSLWPNESGTSPRPGARSQQHRKERPPMMTNSWPRARDTRIPSNVVRDHGSGRPQDDIDTSLHL